jgi:two-component system response regulator DegU
MLGNFEDIDVIGVAADGEEALEKTGEHHPEVVLMDINLPRLNGIEATRLLNQRFPDIAVVLLTLYEELALQAADRDLKISGCVLKEAGPERIHGTVLQAFRKARAGQQ